MKLLPLIAVCALRSWSLLLLAFAGVILLASASRANVISPGTSGASPDNFTSLSGLNFVASNSATASAANFTEAVYRNSAGILDFMFQVTNTSSDLLFTREANTNFTGFSTDVGYITNGSTLPSSPFVDGTGGPLSVDRSVNGSTVGFNFTGFVGNFFQVGLIGTTDVLVIATNATNFDSNGTVALSFSLGGGGGDPFEPVATPLPAALPLFVTGLGGLGLLGWRRKRKAQAVA